MFAALDVPSNLRAMAADQAHNAMTRIWTLKRNNQYGPLTPPMAAALCPRVWSSLGAPMPETRRSLRRLARVATAASGYDAPNLLPYGMESLPSGLQRP